MFSCTSFTDVNWNSILHTITHSAAVMLSFGQLQMCVNDLRNIAFGHWLTDQVK